MNAGERLQNVAIHWARAVVHRLHYPLRHYSLQVRGVAWLRTLENCRKSLLVCCQQSCSTTSKGLSCEPKQVPTLQLFQRGACLMQLLAETSAFLDGLRAAVAAHPLPKVQEVETNGGADGGCCTGLAQAQLIADFADSHHCYLLKQELRCHNASSCTPSR